MSLQPHSNQTVFLRSRPVGEPLAENFELRSTPVASPSSGQLLYRTLFLSIDPYLRGRMSAEKSYIAPIELGAPMVSGFVAEVIESTLPSFPKGALVAGMGPWSTYGVSDGKGLSLIPKGPTPSAILGVLGMPGLTAYVGLIDIGKPKANETVVVSAASGAVGAVVCQLAKLRGCRVIGIAGGEEKCAYVEKELGADRCIDYRNADVEKALAESCPSGIDIYFENVGGKIFEAVLSHLADHARIALCGMISEYNTPKPLPGPNLRPLLVHKASIQGFIAAEHWDRLPALHAEIGPLVAAGQFKFREDIIRGLENAPEALMRVLKGKNFGKQLVCVADL